MRIAVTGAAGMFGHALFQVCQGKDLISLTHENFDISMLDEVINTIRRIKPDFLIHAAAFANVDGCELDPEKAYRVNGVGTRNVVMACEEINCPIIYLSTDYVFDGTKGEPYNEWDPTHPINNYGLSKMLGERFVTSLTNRFYIVRTSWLFGKNGPNFVETILGLLNSHNRLEVVKDQIGAPTFTYDLARAVVQLLGKGYGIYHMTNLGHCSWYEFALAIAELTGMETPIMPITSDKISRPAKRPAYSVLGSTMLKFEGIQNLRPWQEALKDYLSSR